MENLHSVGTSSRSCWLVELDHMTTPLTPLTPMTSFPTAGFSCDSNSCSYLEMTPPDSEYVPDDWSAFQDWSCRWKRCSKCQVLINPEEPSFTVMDAVFHNSCMTCANCCKPITKDDSFGVDRKHVYCSAHFKTAEPVLPSFGGRAAWNQCMELDPGKPEELRNWTENTYPVLSNLVHGERRATETRNTTCWRSCPAKRVRTAFSSDQLDVLNSFFKAGRRPTVKQLEELSGVTGLKVNVLKVWFQNARAKLRRSFSNKMKENVNTFSVTP